MPHETPLNHIAERISAVFGDHGVKYAIVGGVAASAFGNPRTTRDIDVLLDVKIDQVDVILSMLAKAGLDPGPRAGIVASKLREGLPAKIAWDAKYSIDFRVATYAIDKSAVSGSVVVEVLNARLPIARPEALIVYKMARFSEIDQGDIKSILMAQAGKMDWKRVVSWAGQLAKEANLPQISKRLVKVRTWHKRAEKGDLI